MLEINSRYSLNLALCLNEMYYILIKTCIFFQKPGDCFCKANVTYSKCDRCKPGFYNLTAENPDGCLGKNVVNYYRILQKHPMPFFSLSTWIATLHRAAGTVMLNYCCILKRHSCTLLFSMLKIFFRPSSRLLINFDS